MGHSPWEKGVKLGRKGNIKLKRWEEEEKDEGIMVRKPVKFSEMMEERPGRA